MMEGPEVVGWMEIGLPGRLGDILMRFNFPDVEVFPFLNVKKIFSPLLSYSGESWCGVRQTGTIKTILRIQMQKKMSMRVIFFLLQG